jgi:predicted nucleic acid-binding protein
VQFVDTDVLLYTISRDRPESEKAERSNALLAGCDVVLSEDLAHDTDYAGVRVESPFVGS